MKSMLLSFFVLLSLSQVRASDTLTIRQVFNFNVGDTFDYRLTQFNQCVGFSTTAYVRKIVIQKSYSIAQDTIYYQYNLPLGNGSPFFYVSQFDTITNLDSFAIHLTDSILSPGNTAGCTSARYDTTMMCGYASDSTSISCFESAHFIRYTNRLGMTCFNMAGGGDPCGSNGSTYELIHFMNDSMHCGFDILDGAFDLSKTPNVHLNPNPTTDQIHLSISDMNGSDYQLTLTDLLSQEVYTSSITKSESTHEISNLSSGMYMWRVIENNAIIRSGKIVKQ